MNLNEIRDRADAISFQAEAGNPAELPLRVVELCELVKALADETLAQTRTRFKPPTVAEVQAYCEEHKKRVDAAAFVDYYDSIGWYRGKVKMKSWQKTVNTWDARSKQSQDERTPL